MAPQAMILQYVPPAPLLAKHQFDRFQCGENTLDDWLRRRALTNQLSGASRTFVVADLADRIYGYYALAAGAVSHDLARSGVRRNMPDPIPVIVLARLAVDQDAQGVGLVQPCYKMRWCGRSIFQAMRAYVPYWFMH